MTHDLIIIGGGPAGITAGIYAARQKLNTLLIAKIFGGQMTRKAVDIENYPGFEKISGIELIQKFEKHLRKQEIATERDTVKNVKKNSNSFSVLTVTKKEFKAKTVIIASGADPRKLEVLGEKEFIGRGISYCVTCDGPLFSDKVVAVIGGGNTGFEAAISLNKIAKKIYIFEYNLKVGANNDNQEVAKKTGKIEVITNAVIKEIKGKDFVDSIIYQNKNKKKNTSLTLEGVFVEIGSQPATSFVKDLVEFNEKDEIKTDPENRQTKTPGLFAAGDVDNCNFKQIVIAAGEGAQAALSAYKYLQRINGK